MLDESSWIDIARGWIADADDVFASVRDHTRWEHQQAIRLDHLVAERRRSAVWKPGRPMVHATLGAAHAELQRRYRVPFEGYTLAWYRNGHDCQPFDRVRELRWLEDTLVGVLFLGASRPFLLRRRPFEPHDREVGPSQSPGVMDLRPAAGDLIVMGGRCQAQWEHSQPKALGITEGRIAIQWRWSARVGRPQIAPGDAGERLLGGAPG